LYVVNPIKILIKFVRCHQPEHNYSVMKIFTLLLFLSLSTAVLIAQDINYSLNEIVRIGDDAQITNNEILFAFPNAVMVDDEENIYVSDQRLNKIKKFTKEGEFITSFGERGRGPGEFVDLSVVFLDSSNEGELVVFDRTMLRASTFSLEGDHLATHKSPSEDIISPWMGRADSAGNYFLLYRMLPVIPDQPRPENDNLVHVFSSGFAENRVSVADASLFGDLDSYFIERFVGGPQTGIIEILPDDRLVVAPFLYQGSVYIYGGSNWENKMILESSNEVEKVYEQVNAGNAPDYAVRIGTPRGAVAAIVYSTAIGVHAVGDKYLALYTAKIDDNSSEEVGVSLFDIDSGDFLGYTKIDELSQLETGDRITPGWNIQIMNYNNGKLFILDRRSEVPVIVVADIELNVN